MTSLMTQNQYNNQNNVIIASLQSETMGKLINRIPGSRVLISSLPGLALKTLVESLGKPRDVNKCSRQASGRQQVFSKPCLVNLKPRDVNKGSQSLAW